MYPIRRAMITMETVIKTAAVPPPTTPLLSVIVVSSVCIMYNCKKKYVPINFVRL